MLAPLAGALTPLVSNVAGVSYLLGPFRFTTDQSAPLTSPYTEAGAVGSLTVTDTGNNVSTTGGQLNVSGSTAVNDPRVVSTASLSRTPGRAALVTVRFTDGRYWCYGFSTSASSWNLIAHGLITGGGLDLYATFSSLVNLPMRSGVANATNYDMVIVLRAVGAFYIINNAVEWVDAALTSTPLFVGESSRDVRWAGTSDNLRVTDLPAPWTSDYGIATNRTASPSAGASATMEANAIIEFTWTAATGATLELDVRRTDASNRWIVRGSQAGSTIKLIECNAGVETERSSAAQTWTNGTSYRVVVVCDGTTIRTYVANVLKNSYTSASFNQSATGVQVSHAGTDLVTWPRTLSGTALSTLQAV